MIDQELFASLFPEKVQSLHDAAAILATIETSIITFNTTFFATDIFGDPATKPVTYIGELTKFGKFYSTRVLASNGREVIAVCSRESEEEARAYTEEKYPGVTWVLSNRFQQELACL